MSKSGGSRLGGVSSAATWSAAASSPESVRHEARVKFKMKRSVSGKPATATASPQAGGVSPSFRSAEQSRPPAVRKKIRRPFATAMTRPSARRIPVFESSTGDL